MVEKWIWRSLAHFALMPLMLVFVLGFSSWLMNPFLIYGVFLYGFFGGSFCWYRAYLAEQEEFEAKERDES